MFITVSLIILMCLCGGMGAYCGYRDGINGIVDTIQEKYPDVAEYILSESKSAYDEDELHLRAELLRARDRA